MSTPLDTFSQAEAALYAALQAYLDALLAVRAAAAPAAVDPDGKARVAYISRNYARPLLAGTKVPGTLVYPRTEFYVTDPSTGAIRWLERIRAPLPLDGQPTP